VLGVFVGINLITSGAAIVMAALAARSLAGAAGPVPAPARWLAEGEERGSNLLRVAK
jgi:hypothetical protein